MKYYKEDDNRYRVNFMVATEELMDRLTVKEFISYLEENAELEDDEDYEYISGKVVKCRAYDLKEADSKLHKEFLVTEDGRVFYWLSLNQKIELVDREEEKQEVSKEKEMVAGVVNRLIKDFFCFKYPPFQPQEALFPSLVSGKRKNTTLMWCFFFLS